MSETRLTIFFVLYLMFSIFSLGRVIEESLIELFQFHPLFIQMTQRLSSSRVT
jgi:hypothetical protein